MITLRLTKTNGDGLWIDPGDILYLQRVPDIRKEDGMPAEDATEYTVVATNVLGELSEWGVIEHPDEILSSPCFHEVRK